MLAQDVRWIGGRVERVGGCGAVTGQEEGFWRAREDGTMAWDLLHCSLRRFERQHARECLQGRHILFLGDSVLDPPRSVMPDIGSEYPFLFVPQATYFGVGR